MNFQAELKQIDEDIYLMSLSNGSVKKIVRKKENGFETLLVI